ncbi:MAG: DNA adenine methylase [Woeseia sp.]|nr:DNA adenine methylase [Woeseia sp.]
MIAPMVWERFGSVKNLVEPFFGSGAVLLAAPWPAKRIETVNDLDGLLCNFWRALQADSDALAAATDWPVSELDLHARGDWLVQRRGDLTERLRGDPNYYDIKAAAWWVWGACAWIGSGWAEGNAGRGVNRQLPHLGDAGQGVNRQLPHLGSAGRDDAIRTYFSVLAGRLRDVRVCCGDWSRVTGPSPTFKNGLTAVFLDPPYCAHDRVKLYAEDSFRVALNVQRWCVENADNPLLRIALCGYDTDYDLPGWDCVAWKAVGGYGSQGKGRGRSNAGREVIWFSPHCLGQRQETLFTRSA